MNVNLDENGQSMLQGGVTADGGNDLQLGSHVTLALLSGSSASTPVQRSKQGSSSADEDSTSRAMKRAVARNLDYTGGNAPPAPLNSEQIISSLQVVGVSVEKSNSDRAKSIATLQRVEECRTKPEVSFQPSSCDELLDEEDNSNFFSPLRHLCDDLIDETLDRDGSLSHSIVEVPIQMVSKWSDRKAKSSNKKTKKKIIFK